jgi:dCMP deaminase
MNRPSWDEYFMSIAYNVAERSNCVRRQIGAVIVRERNIISTGYNGTPTGVKNCFEGGCPRCAGTAPSGTSLDTCLCVHAEENAICFAARHGARTEGGILFSTTRPCFGCLKDSIQAGISRIVYVEPYDYETELEDVYHELVRESGILFEHIELKPRETA